MRHLPLLSLLTALLCGAPAHAQDDFWAPPRTWQQHLDLHTSAAASSTVLHYRCAPPREQAAAQSATGGRLHQLLSELPELGAAPDEALAYAKEAYRLKISAIWQSSEGQACPRLVRLRDLARAVGYPAPPYLLQ